MTQSILMGDPAYFQIRSGANPHTRDRWGRRKRVDSARAQAQWKEFRAALERLGVRVHAVAPSREQPGLVFPANAGFRYARTVYLSNLHPGRAAEQGYYRRTLEQLGYSVQALDPRYRFEGEADFIRVGDPSGEPSRAVYLFTHGRLERSRWAPLWGWPPYRRVYGFRSDSRMQPVLEEIVRGHEVISLELIDEAHYHGDTLLCPFGPHEEFLLAYLEGLAPEARALLERRFWGRLVRLSEADGRGFAANSFQVISGGKPVLLMPEGLSPSLIKEVADRGVSPCPVDVSEFMEKGGGSVKCMILNLGEAEGATR